MRAWTTVGATAAALVIAVASANPSRADGVTTIRGTVFFKGDPAKYERSVVDRSPDPACAKEVKKVETEKVILNTRTKPVTVRNVLVAISGGTEGLLFATPPQPVVLMQHGCRFDPHILGVMERQPLRILNADQTASSVHFLSQVNDQFRFTLPKRDLEKGGEVNLRFMEAPFQVKSDIHPWMNGYIAVFDHPFFGVTGKTGMYELRGMPPGNYMLRAWHETFGTLTTRVTIARGEQQTVDFTYEPGK